MPGRGLSGEKVTMCVCVCVCVCGGGGGGGGGASSMLVQCVYSLQGWGA